MTGYESKRAAAQDKLDDDDALTIAYQSGYYDGKKAAQPAQEPIKQVLDAEFNRGYKEGVRDAYAKSPQRTWVGLTDEEFKKMVDDAGFTRTDLLMIGDCVEQLVDLVEATLRSKNT
jgi:flagellar biosynthesis/type III secretory pathway protein FliH